MTALCFPLSAQECFSKAEILYAKGFYLDAQTLFDRAVQLEPTNDTYSQGRARLSQLAFSFGNGFGKKHSPVNHTDCTQSCCEVCGEGCGNGCCESCCEAIGDGDCCDGCDCDCG